jgi:DNA-binding transcriptional MerR regulator
MTARNVRAYQTKGLIPPPTRQGRRSVYSAEHLQRLQAIERARARGASLSLIATHLAQGRPLDDDTLISWLTDPAVPASNNGGGAGEATAGSQHRAEIGPLLAKLNHQRNAAAHAQVEALIAAGVFEQVGRRVYTGRDLAAALTALQKQGLGIEVALGVAQRAITAAAAIAAAVQQEIAGLDAGTETMTGPLGDVAGCVVRHVVSASLAT